MKSDKNEVSEELDRALNDISAAGRICKKMLDAGYIDLAECVEFMNRVSCVYLSEGLDNHGKGD